MSNFEKRNHQEISFGFELVKKDQEQLIKRWLEQNHVKEWIHGQGLLNTLVDLENFLNRRKSVFQHWIVYDQKEKIPFAYFLTTEPNVETVTIDFFIGEENYLGKGLATLIIKNFLKENFSHKKFVTIDPEKANSRAIHVYEKVGFKIINEFIANWHPVPHLNMKLEIEELKQSINLGRPNLTDSKEKMKILSSELTDNMSDIFGEKGKIWLNKIPDLLNELKLQWNFSNIKELHDLTYSYVASVNLKNGQEGIVKILPPDRRRALAEIAWYKFNLSGTVKIYETEENVGAILMQRLVPGDSLKKLVKEGKDEDATRILSKSILKLNPQKNQSFEFKHVSQLGDDLKFLEGKIDSKIVDHARGIFKELTSDKSKDVPIHGDIHHGNVLSHGNEWLIIDPHGYLGPRAFEVGAMIRNPYDCFPTYFPLKKIISKRLDILNEELPFSRDEIWGWAFAYTVMSTAWSVNDHSEVPKDHLEIINLLLKIKPGIKNAQK